MEHIVNGSGQEQLELVRHRGDLFNDLEGSISFGHELSHLVGEL